MADSKIEDASVDHSCLVTVKWEWTEKVGANRWSRPQQAIKPKRQYIPEDPNSQSDGHGIVFSKLKVRGHGRALVIRFESEDGKDFHLYGWAIPVTSETVA